MSEEKKDLLPCPFCGSSAMLEELGDHHGAYHNLGCSKRECPAHHAIYTESEAPVEDSVNWWNTRAALQESEAGAVYECPKCGAEMEISMTATPSSGYFLIAPQSAKAIETAAIMKCVEVCDEVAALVSSKDHRDACNGIRNRILALIPQDGRTALEEFGMKVAKKVESDCRTGLEWEIRSIVTNLIGEK